ATPGSESAEARRAKAEAIQLCLCGQEAGLLRFARNDGGGLSILRRNVFQARRMRGDVFETVLQMHALVRRRLLRRAHARAPFLRRADRPRRKAAAAVRADIAEFCLDAIGAEGALV